MAPTRRAVGATVDSSGAQPAVVPYYVLPNTASVSAEQHAEHNTTYIAKALFTVPGHLAERLAARPILCRGATFHLLVDEQSTSPRSVSILKSWRASEHDVFLMAEFHSVAPQITANAIAQRLAVRIQDEMSQLATEARHPAASMLGF